MGPSDDEFPVVTNRQRPDLAMVPLELLDELKLVTVPVLEHLVLANSPEIVRWLALAFARIVALKCYLHDTLVMGED